MLFLLPRAAAVAAFAAAVALAAWEWAGLLRARPCSRLWFGVLTLVPCAALYLAGMPRLPLLGLWGLALIFWLLLVPLWFRRGWSLHGNLPGFLVGWLLLIPSWAGMVMLYAYSAWLLLAALALVWVADIAAYFSGRAFGRHKLAPTISPGKTWEGAAGAVLAVLIYGFAVGQFSGGLAQLTVPQILLAGLGLLLLTVISIFGDLFESLAKRQAGLKDSSGLLPGHGGVLDRIDSLTSTLPFAGLAITWAL